MVAFISLALGTLISEDLACVTAGLLIQRGEISASAGVLACTLGIFAGDVGLWGAGRAFGRAALAWPWIARRLHRERSQELCDWLERHAAGAIVASRFLPGTRLPLYLVAGVLKLPARVFAGWALVGTLMWTPIVVLLTAGLGETVITRFSPTGNPGWIASLVTVAGVLLSLQVVRGLGSRSRPHGRIGDRDAARGTRWPLDVRSSGSG